ncbi:hypothetical protein AB0953_32610 [Streptomyces sp. NPDC046866]|uniref:hypothetical protein n=1 Tax=Streptomyces sp. NPDC046866 TaxID=3154921 RepID=UPI00345652E5
MAQPAPKATGAVDLMEALRASVERVRSPKDTREKATTRSRWSQAAWDHLGMRLVADRATPTSRLVLVKDLETDDGYAFELASPIFLTVGDRIAFDQVVGSPAR